MTVIKDVSKHTKPVTTVKKQAMWFTIVGIIAAAVHFCTLVLCVQIANVLPVWANVIAFLVAFVVSFSGHFKLTFTHSITQSTSPHNQFFATLLKWFVTSVGGFLLNQLIFIMGLKVFGNGWYMLIWLCATGIVTVLTFLLGKLWAFKH